MGRFAMEAADIGAIGLGAHVDSGIYRGSFEDLEDLKKASTLPVVCDDFVIYGYQVFRAKAAGADAIRLMASVLSAKEMRYLAKMANALGLTVIAVVSSKPQALDVLENVTEAEIVSFSSRNMRLWKLDPGKAHRLLSDPEIASAIARRRRVADEGSSNFLIMQEGLTDSNEITTAKTDNVDVLYLGEELGAFTNSHNLQDAMSKLLS